MSALKRYQEDLRLDLEDSEVFEAMATQQEYNLVAAMDSEPDQWLLTYTPNSQPHKCSPHFLQSKQLRQTLQ